LLRIKDVASALFEHLPQASDEEQVEQLKHILLGACNDASADINDPIAEQVIAEWLSESLALYTPSNSWASVYYLYGYLKGFRHKTMLDSEMDPETDEWLRGWVGDHFEVGDEAT
jgi:hypothetical protein